LAFLQKPSFTQEPDFDRDAGRSSIAGILPILPLARLSGYAGYGRDGRTLRARLPLTAAREKKKVSFWLERFFFFNNSSGAVNLAFGSLAVDSGGSSVLADLTIVLRATWGSKVEPSPPRLLTSPKNTTKSTHASPLCVGLVTFGVLADAVGREDLSSSYSFLQKHLLDDSVFLQNTTSMCGRAQLLNVNTLSTLMQNQA
jgi:hypothetical protein